jgi:hypothetical protein
MRKLRLQNILTVYHFRKSSIMIKKELQNVKNLIWAIKIVN